MGKQFFGYRQAAFAEISQCVEILHHHSILWPMKDR
jgi:hypothetical protein